MTNWNRALLSTVEAAILALLAVGCSEPANVGGGPGGPTGGANGVGGGISAGGASGGGGGLSAGGAISAGGTISAGGGLSAGGAISAGGTIGSGGASGTAGTGGSIEPPVPKPSLVTSGAGAYWQVGAVTAGSGSPTVTVNVDDQKVVWHGFGGTFNERGWDALLELSEADRALAIRLLFSKNEGAGFTWGRIPIGASDYAMDRYTLCDTQSPDMSAFSIERDRELLIPFIKAAQAVKPDIKFWGSPWTPPPWMKTNNDYDKGVMKSDDANLDSYAQYFVKWVQAYAAEGITIDHVHPQNEPGWSQSYPSCAWGPFTDNGTNNSSTQPFMGTFVEQNLAPAFQDAGLQTRIWYGTLSNDTWFPNYWGNLTPAGRNLITGVALQWGTMGRIGTIKNEMPNTVIIMQSEHKCGNYPWLGAMASSPQDANRDNFLSSQAPNNHAYGEETWDLITDWLEAGVHIYSAWNMVLDTGGFSLDTVRPWPQNTLLVVDRNANTLIPTPAYYVFRHVAQYVDPGAIRVGTTGGDALAFQNPDGSIATIMFNSGQSPANTVLSVGGTLAQFTIPARGWATVNTVP